MIGEVFTDTVQIAKSLTCLGEHEIEGMCICIIQKAFADAHIGRIANFSR